ncbi:Lrp/AsnC family transcriptional regulator [Longispora sp. K20-0274]|uniref:Lrp/AsnC family transcriptional regulator n=1 Tax=Longispora sp. K20-0274 TaxID=3088255 RepID=UPI003999C371
MTGDITLDGLDRRIVCALQVDGRASSTRIGEVLGVSARTVVRRLARLDRSGVLRVVRVPEVSAYPAGALVLRVRVLRGRVDVLADALARRDDVPYVDIALGGEEIVALAVTGPGDRDRLLYEQLPATTAVTATTAQAVLHVFADASSWRAGWLTAEEVRALESPPDGPSEVSQPPGELDRALLDRLAVDARVGTAALAAAVGAPESTVRRHLHRLGAAGLLRTHATIDARLLGMAVDATLWMTVPPDRLEAVGTALAGHRYVHGVVATTGATNLLATLFTPDLPALYGFVTRVLGPLGVPAAETTVVGRAVKRAGVRQSTPA